MQLALTTLLISSLSSAGLLALWAATSPRHWFLRTAVFLGVVSLLLLIPAYEPWVAFVLQGAVVAGGIGVYRWRCRATEVAPPGRFSLATLMQLFVVVAVVVAVGSKLPPLNLVSWVSVILIGITGGVMTLLAYWIVREERVLLWRRLVLGACIAGGFSYALWWGDSFALSVLGRAGWPAEDISVLAPWVAEPSTGSFWMGIVSSHVFIVVLLTYLLQPLFSISQKEEAICENTGPSGIRMSHVAGVLLAVIVALPAAYTYWELINPLPIPEVELPEPNGYEDLHAAWTMLPANTLVDGMNFDAEKNPLAQVAKATAEANPALSKAREGLKHPCLYVVDYHSGIDSLFLNIQNSRSLARAFSAEGVLARRQGDFELAFECSLDLITYGYALRRGRLIIGELVGIACSGVGRNDLYQLRFNLQPEQCQRAIASLSNELEDAEPMENFVYRDRVWTQHSQGWHGRLTLLVEDSSETLSREASFREADLREQAEMRLLMVELAIQAHRVRHGKPPESAADLELLSGKLPEDPFSPEGAPLHYAKLEDGYLLYSIGPDQIDDQGQTNPNAPWGMEENTDLRLDLLYAPEEDPNVETNAAE